MIKGDKVVKPTEATKRTSEQKLFRVLQEYRHIEEYLEASGGDLTDEIIKELETLDDKREEYFYNVFHLYQNALADLDAVTCTIDRLNEIKRQRNAKLTSLNKLLVFALKLWGDQNVDGVKIGLRVSKRVNADALSDAIDSVAVNDKFPTAIAEDIADTLCKIIEQPIAPDVLNVKISVSPDKTAIKERISKGGDVPTCSIEINDNLKIG